MVAGRAGATCEPGTGIRRLAHACCRLSCGYLLRRAQYTPGRPARLDAGQSHAFVTVYGGASQPGRDQRAYVERQMNVR